MSLVSCKKDFQMGEGEERMTEPWGPALKIFLRETPRTRWGFLLVLWPERMIDNLLLAENGNQEEEAE